MELKKFEEQISKTGFPLEYNISSLLRASGWIVINNRYYVDDQEQSVREIDLVAYRVKPVQHFKVVTTLIVSCKKSDQNIWAVLAREKEPFDPNLDTQPVHTWTNDKSLSFMLSRSEWASKYYRQAQESGVQRILSDPDVHVFAFQEMNRTSGSPQNDRPIFSSITSLMKAQSYEIDALPRRKKTPCVYQFNLLNIVDTQLIQLYFDKSGQRASEIEDEQYVARYIINRRDTFARIHFIRADRFKAVLRNYDRLHTANCGIFSKACDEFYHDVLSDADRRQVLLPEFEKLVRPRLESRLRLGLQMDAKLEGMWFWWDKQKRIAELMLPIDSKAVDLLNNDADIRTYVARALKRIFRYEDEFIFSVDDLPF